MGIFEPESIQANLAQLGGAAVGTGAGMLGTLQMDKMYQAKLLNEARKVTVEKKMEEFHLRNALKLYTGQKKMEEIPISERPFYKEVLQNHETELEAMARQPRLAKMKFDDLKSGRIIEYPGKPSGQPKKLFPFKVRHPLSAAAPALGGLGGMVLGGQLMNRHTAKNQETE